MSATTQTATISDSHTVTVALSHDSIRLALKGFERYRPYLTQMLEIEARFELDRSPVAVELEKLDRTIGWCREKEKIPVFIDFYSYMYRDLRWLKAGMLLAVNDLKRERETQFAKYSSLPVAVVEAINFKIAAYENMAESGVFNGMAPIPLVINSTAPIEMRVEIADSSKLEASKVSWVVMRVELLDTELRRRCGDLYEQFTADLAHQDRFDTVLREASALLEDRIRASAGLPTASVGLDLVSRAFAPDSGELIISADHNEQEAAHLLFRGFFGFVRNSVQHRLVPTYTQERAAQVLGLADYLLFVLSQAKRRAAVRSGAPVRSS
jgi:uncharacterized protein (TIGR02391 family)